DPASRPLLSRPTRSTTLLRNNSCSAPIWQSSPRTKGTRGRYVTPPSLSSTTNRLEGQRRHWHRRVVLPCTLGARGRRPSNASVKRLPLTMDRTSPSQTSCFSCTRGRACCLCTVRLGWCSPSPSWLPFGTADER